MLHASELHCNTVNYTLSSSHGKITHFVYGMFWVKMVMSGLDISLTMLTIGHAELRVINSGRTFLNFFLDRPTPPALNFSNKEIYHTLVHHLA